MQLSARKFELRRLRWAAVAVAPTVILCALLAPTGTAATGAVRAAAATPPAFTVDRAQTYEVAQEVGTGSINKTAKRWDVYGADLGSMFTYRHRLYMVFGDTFGGPAANSFFSVDHANWRSNTMAFVASGAQPRHGLYFNGIVTGPSGQAKQLLSSEKVSGTEQTVIPTYGTAVGGTMYLYFMSVKQYGAPGHWSCNYSGVASSTDGGAQWTKEGKITWGPESNFGQVALVKNGSFVYVLGIPCGRYGSVDLARVPEGGVLDKTSYQYWDGHGWAAQPAAAVPIVPAPVGELSVQWNSFYRRWLMMYLVDPKGQIVIRTSGSLYGPWTRAQVVVTSAQYPELYAPYITPEWDSGPSIYFNMSMFGPYHVVLMHTQLEK
jgi:hypothetical protein